jgi:hypothetical protein
MDFTNVFYALVAQRLAQAIGGIAKNILDQQFYCKLKDGSQIHAMKLRQKGLMNLKIRSNFIGATQL